MDKLIGVPRTFGRDRQLLIEWFLIKMRVRCFLDDIIIFLYNCVD